MTILDHDSDPCRTSKPGHSGYFSAWDCGKWLKSAPIPVRKSAIRTTAHTLHSLWRDGYDLTDFPPVLWRFTRDEPHPQPIIPYLYLKKSARPHTMDEMIRILASWYSYGQKQFRKNERLCFLQYFLEEEPVAHDRFAYLIREIEEYADRRATRIQKRNLTDSPLHA